MSASQVHLVYRKEMVDTLRDRRTLISMIVVPMVVIPGLILGMGKVIRSILEGAKRGKTSVMILGSEHAPTLSGIIMRQSGEFEIVAPDTSFMTRIQNKKLRSAIEFPAGFEAELAAAGGQPDTVKIYYHENELRSELARSRLTGVVEAYSQALVEQRLAARDLSRDDLHPFQRTAQNVASSQGTGGEAFGGFIPYIIILLTMMGAMYPAIDLTAGEKERGTIETILASPVSRTSLAFGKFLAVVTAALATAMLALTSLAISSRIAAGDPASAEFTALQVSIDATNAAAMLLMMLPVAVLFSAVLVAIALKAKTYKEAQSYISPLNMAVIIPAVSSMFPGIELDLQLALIPILNVSLASKQVIAGNYEWNWIAVIFVSSCVYAGIALAVAVQSFKRESVLFRT